MIPLTKKIGLGSLLHFLVRKLQGWALIILDITFHSWKDSDLKEELINIKGVVTKVWTAQAVSALTRRDCRDIPACLSLHVNLLLMKLKEACAPGYISAEVWKALTLKNTHFWFWTFQPLNLLKIGSDLVYLASRTLEIFKEHNCFIKIVIAWINRLSLPNILPEGDNYS